ncbi:MAG: kynureninase [Gammaproteobacteria bacterium]|nr:kynureninase [Gammaproteobacteria bacterium]
MQYENTKAYAKQQDDLDPLRAYRDQFYLPYPDKDRCTYFCGNSLGLQPKSARDAVAREFDEWAYFAVDGHFEASNPWYSYHEILTPPMAGIVGAKQSEVVCMNSLTTNLHLLFVSFYRPTATRFKIISEGKMFPSDRYLLETQARFHGFDPDDAVLEIHPRGGESIVREADILDAIQENADELALVFFGGVNYFTGQLFDMQTITKAAHAAGAVAGFDLAHAAGNVPLQLHDWDVDFAAWCSYKYLNASPGNVGAIFVHERHGESFDLPRFGGWWGHDKDRRFLMESGFTPMKGAEGWQLSNVPIFSMSILRASVDIFDEVGMDALREKSEKLTGYLEFVIDSLADEFPGAGIRIITPRDPNQRGCQISLIIEGRERDVFERLTAAGVISDFREPCMIRLAPVPLYNSFEDVHTFGEVMKGILADGEAAR